MIETIIVAAVVAAAVVWAVVRIVRTLRGRGECSCGCKDCPMAGGCRKRR